MPSLKNFLLYGLLLVSAANAIPSAAVESTFNETEALSHSLERRKNSNKCEAWFHVDSKPSHRADNLLQYTNTILQQVALTHMRARTPRSFEFLSWTSQAT